MKVEEAFDFFEDTRAKDEQLGCLGLGHLCRILEAHWKHDSGTWCASLMDRTQWTQRYRCGAGRCLASKVKDPACKERRARSRGMGAIWRFLGSFCGGTDAVIRCILGNLGLT